MDRTRRPRRRARRWAAVTLTTALAPAVMKADGLTTYRLSADGEAQAVLDAAAPGQRDRALEAVVRRFFLSSYGDQAAYELGCLSMDRGDWAAARRLLLKVTQQYPDPKVDRGRALSRLAVA